MMSIELFNSLGIVDPSSGAGGVWDNCDARSLSFIAVSASASCNVGATSLDIVALVVKFKYDGRVITFDDIVELSNSVLLSSSAEF